MPGFPRISIDLLFSAALAATIGFGAQAFIPAPALAEDCPGHPDALGTSRVLVVDPAKIHHVGVMQYPQSLPLADKEVDIVSKWLKVIVLFETCDEQLMTCRSSPYETTSMLVERSFHWRTYRTKNTVISS